MAKIEIDRKTAIKALNAVLGKDEDNVPIMVGYEGDHFSKVIHKEGDKWVDGNGDEWIVKNGIRQNVTYFDDLRIPIFCPACAEPMNNRHDSYYYKIYGFCMNCYQKLETKMVIEGKFDRFYLEKIKSNLEFSLKQMKEKLSILEKSDINKLFYIGENGEIENWDGNLDKDYYVQKLKERIESYEKVLCDINNDLSEF